MLRHLMTIAAIAVTLTACSGGSESEAPPTSPPAGATGSAGVVIETVMLTDQGVEAGCGLCSYSMEGVDHCQTAVVVDGVPRLVAGLGEDAHSLGLCSGTKQALVSGSATGDAATLTKLEIQ